ncbi:TIGR03617 family F420-dependent LLM class oxidoreductase [Actinomadura parmotrematis]|uniref:TIGR03617 family F420-dependent LLM class oxidoreductase n=1 Tax=Actinomadura parmotrematis TaxID=2864039 RepID=A0ABS7G4U9_9ACTN|nr:TIGR03617 family F420-dependent LLM class oxidoreductase [Actinomadura parmotrematis]MBW8487496.1 TIGR03617 family F420-dependent LLM class oxidoreductase [Actinomadura parmotrematis]
MSPKLDVILAESVAEAADRARALQGTGVDGVFTFENSHDVFFPLVAAAPVCTLDLLTNVAIAFPRSPMHLANSAYDLHLLSQGRFRLGLGSQIRTHIEKRFGSRWEGPVPQMREWVLAVKAILRAWQDGTRLDFRGEHTVHTLMTPAFDPGPNPYGVPKVLVGALGPRMNRMAAEVADGVLVMPFNSARHMRERTMPAIEAGLAASGRTRADLELTAEVIVAVGRTDQEIEAATAGARATIAFYGSTPAYRSVLDAEGLGDLQPELNALSKQGRWAEMTALVTDDLLATFAAHGTPERVAAEITARYGDCDRVCAFFPGFRAPDDLVADLAAALKARPAEAQAIRG